MTMFAVRAAMKRSQASLAQLSRELGIDPKAVDKPKRQRFKRYPIGFLHIDIAEVQTSEGRLYLFAGLDRTSSFAVASLVGKADRRTAWKFLQHMLEAFGGPHPAGSTRS